MTSYDETIRGLYDAAASLTTWPSALARVSALTNSWFTQLVGLDKKFGRIAFSVQCPGAPIDGVMDYVRLYHRIDPHTNQALRQPIGVPYNGARVVPDRLVESNPFYRDFFLPYGARYTIGAKIVDDEELFSAFAVLRRPDQPAYSADEEKLLGALSIHMTGAVSIMKRFASFQVDAGIGRALLERTDRPSFLIEPTKAIRFANKAGRSMLDAAELMEARAGFLCCIDPDSDSRLIERIGALHLDEAIAMPADAIRSLDAEGAGNGDAGSSQVPFDDAGQARLAFPIRHPTSKRPVPACLWSIRPEGTMGAFGTTPVAILTLATTGSGSTPDPVVLASMFDLTPAEARVASALCEGLASKEIGIRLRVGEDTIRFHIRNLLRKAGAANQKELVSALRTALQF